MANETKSILTSSTCFTADKSVLNGISNINNEMFGLFISKDTSANPEIKFQLHVAAINLDFTKINDLISASVCNINDVDHQGFNALHWCLLLQMSDDSSRKYYPMIQYLINIGINVNYHLPMLNRRSALHLLNHYDRNRFALYNALLDRIRTHVYAYFVKITKVSFEETDHFFLDSSVENRISLMKLLMDAGIKNTPDNCFVTPFIASSLLWRGFAYSYLKDAPNNQNNVMRQINKEKYTNNLKKQYYFLSDMFTLEVREVIREAIINANIHLGSDHYYSKYKAILVKHGCQTELDYFWLIEDLFKDGVFDFVQYTFLILIIDRFAFEEPQNFEINSNEELLLLKWFLLVLSTFGTGIFFDYFSYNWPICKLTTSFSSQTLTLKLTFLKKNENQLIADIFAFNGNVVLIEQKSNYIYNTFTYSHPSLPHFFENIFSVLHYFLSDASYEISHLTTFLHSYVQCVMNINIKPPVIEPYHWILRLFIFLRLWAFVKKEDIVSVTSICASIAQSLHCPLLVHYLLQKFHNLNSIRKRPLFISRTNNLEFWSNQPGMDREEKDGLAEENVFFPIISLFAHQINEQDSNGDTCLHIAAKNNLIRIVEFLLNELNAYTYGFNYNGLLYLDLLSKRYKNVYQVSNLNHKSKLCQPYTLLTISAKVLANFSVEYLNILNLPKNLYKFIQLHVHRDNNADTLHTIAIIKDSTTSTKRSNARKINLKHKSLSTTLKTASIPLQIPSSQHVNKFSEKDISLKIQPNFNFK